jgi:glycosyltransferase involved in cell wall biosynthesis
MTAMANHGGADGREPIVSAVIPVRNGAATIVAAVDSALGQEFDRPFEVVVVNDGSTDETRDVLARYRDRIKLIDLPGRGVAAARNAGILAAQGEYIAFLDADDTWLPHKLARMIAAMDGAPDCVLAFSDLIIVDAAGREIRPSFVTARHARAPSLSDLLTEWWQIFPSATIVQRSTLARIGGFCERFGVGYSAEDVHCWIMAREFGPFRYVSEPLTRYRMPDTYERLHKRARMISERREPLQYVANELYLHRFLRERHGAAAKGLITELRRGAARTLRDLGLAAINLGDAAFARRCYLASLKLWPPQPKTVARMAATLLPAAAARSLSSLLPPRYARALFGPAQAWPARTEQNSGFPI